MARSLVFLALASVSVAEINLESIMATQTDLEEQIETYAQSIQGVNAQIKTGLEASGGGSMALQEQFQAAVAAPVEAIAAFGCQQAKACIDLMVAYNMYTKPSFAQWFGKIVYPQSAPSLP